jgi:3-hydroxybutyryl-CoA dehydratase
MTSDAAMNQILADDLRVGELIDAGPPRVVSQANFLDFAALTGDAHPLHYDADYAAGTRFGKPLAHGLLLMSFTALGATPFSKRLEDSMIAFIEQGCRFLKPVFAGDSLTPEFEVGSVERRDGRADAKVRFLVRLRNAAGDPVLEGHHTYLLRCRPKPEK